ncbi:hypothetical protein [Nitrosopumilus sp. b1]|uniref:hypothetical protein n=1 Tax=Nitrosopumilus sp. b1 TaxID=2109907 RepID=UPI0015F352B1|nr:hypothetical protein [Nitrosopumilus sp. b1]
MSLVQIHKNWQPEPTKTLVERTPAQEGTKLSLPSNVTWQDLQGLSWIMLDDWSD